MRTYRGYGISYHHLLLVETQRQAGKRKCFQMGVWRNVNEDFRHLGLEFVDIGKMQVG